MKTIFTFLVCLIALSGFCQTNRTPINRGYLQGNLDGNGKLITNATFAVGSGGSLSTNAQGLLVIPIGGGGSFTGNANQFGLDGGSNPVIKSGAALTNTILTNATISGTSTNFDGIGVTNLNPQVQIATNDVGNISFSVFNFGTDRQSLFDSLPFRLRWRAGVGKQFMEFDTGVGGHQLSIGASNFTGNFVGNGAGVTNYPTTNATSSLFGVSKPDNSTITASGGVYSVSSVGSAVLPAAQITGAVAIANGGTGSATGDGTGLHGLVSSSSGLATNLTVHSSFQMTTNSSDVIRWYDGQQMYWNVRGVDVATLFMNGLHGGNGNGTELQWSFNQCSFNMFGGGWFQVGAVDGSGLESMYMSVNNLAPSSNTNSPSHFFGLSYSYNNGGAKADFVDMQAIPVGTNGEVALRIYAPVGGSPLPTSMPSTNMLDIDSVTGVKVYSNLNVLGKITNGALTAAALVVTDANKGLSNAVTGTGISFDGHTIKTNGLQSSDFYSALTLAGSGASLTSLNGTQVTSGTVADARLSGNVPLLNASNVFTLGMSIASNLTYTTMVGKTVTISTTNIDASTGTFFKKTLSGNTPFLLSGMTEGETIQIKVANPSTFTVTWTGITWPSNAAPSLNTAMTSIISVTAMDGTNYGAWATNYP